MKITSAIILASISLCASLCCSEDDNFAPEIYINNNTIVQIENNENTFNVDDSIVIETTILNEQTAENGESVLLTDYDYTEIGQSQYQYSLKLFKTTSFGTIAEIPLTQNNINSIEGETLIENDWITVRSLYDGVSYKNKFSITLTETGVFYLAGYRFVSHNDGKLELNGGIYEKGFVYIDSNITNANENGGYQFVVE